MTRRFYLCGGDDRLGARAKCPDRLHDYPLPAGYVDVDEEAMHRLYKRWHSVKCKKCGLYGWVPPLAAAANPPAPVTGRTAEMTDCTRCDGCGRIADSDEGEPWSAWESLPIKSAAARVMGLVRPIPCPDCAGSGTASPEGQQK